MAEKFNGFSQDDIKKLSTASALKSATTNTGSSKSFRGHHGLRRMPEKWTKSSNGLKMQKPSQPAQKDVHTKTTIEAVAEKPLPDVALEEINLDSSLSKSIEEALYYPTLTRPGINGAKVKTNGVLPTVPSSEADDSSILKLPIDSNVTSSASSSLDDSSILTEMRQTTTRGVILNTDSPFKGISLKDFESHRRMIQEQNKQKKDMLYKAIEHHSQKTAAEARKIDEIKSELSKLDSDLAVDVAMLRKQIDNACVHFATIEKQYIKIESQFLKAKIELHNAAEKKELLTEHLCTVIAHNEDRKAQKLSELMQKVGLSPTGDYNLLPTTTPNEDNVDK